MKKFYSSLLLIMVLAISSVSAKTDISLTNRTLSNITATDNEDGSVTFALTDAGSKGTIRFDDIADFTAYQTVFFYYRQDNGSAVDYALNNQYVSNARAQYTPASTLNGVSSFNVQQLIIDGKNMADSYYTVTLKSGTVTLYNVFCIDKVGEDETLLSSLSYSGTANIRSVVALSGIGLKPVFGGDSPTASTYYDLSEYDGVKFELAYPTVNEGTTVSVRFQFVNSDGTGTENVYVNPTPTASGIYTFSFDNYTIPSRKITGIKISTTTDVNFNVVVSNLVAYTDDDTTTSIETPVLSNDDENAIVNVYSITGGLIRKAVKRQDATTGLSKGIYIVGNKKIFVQD